MSEDERVQEAVEAAELVRADGAFREAQQRLADAQKGRVLSRYDLRLRSLDREPGEPISLCTLCDSHACWSVWLHTPEWMPEGGLTSVLCTPCALASVRIAAANHDPKGTP